MSRSILAIITLTCLFVLALGYIAFKFDDNGSGTGIFLVRAKTTTLPFNEVLNKGSFLLEMETVPGRPNEVKIKVHASDHFTWEKREWIQQGPGKFVFNLEGGKEKYFFDIGEFSSAHQAVTSVEISLRYWFISGSRE
jgi:hypothetical protein